MQLKNKYIIWSVAEMQKKNTTNDGILQWFIYCVCSLLYYIKRQII